jgi:hypothetical protein
LTHPAAIRRPAGQDPAEAVQERRQPEREPPNRCSGSRRTRGAVPPAEDPVRAHGSAPQICAQASAEPARSISAA